ncbi:hypothetical protein [Nonomuraea sp. NPDC023979]|uniref:hypothetical protein n=1 Tax=Nonomuraea sp. NPDC023979 TaxID=3154796 RepID=UPI0033C238D9
MARITMALGILAVAVALPFAGATAASATPVQAVSMADCLLGSGVVVPSATSPTRLSCYGGRFHGQPVGGLA